MRLIDADALGVGRCSKDLLPAEHCAGWNALINLIEEAPTIDPESLRPQGKWIKKPSGKYGAWQSWCSVCGKHSGIGGIESNRHKPYCPNCGAKMEGAGKE